MIKPLKEIGAVSLIFILVASMFLTLGLSFLIFNIHGGIPQFTGMEILNSDSSEDLTTRINLKEEARIAIEESKLVIQEMVEEDFSVVSVNDALIEAEKIFQQAHYFEIIRGYIDATDFEKREAHEALKFTNLQEANYSKVLEYTIKIKTIKEQAFFLRDKLLAEENKLASEIDIYPEIQQTLNEAKIAFNEERYGDTEKLLASLDDLLERQKGESSILFAIKEGSKSFIQKYWVYLIILLILFLAGAYIFYKIAHVKFLGKKIKKLLMEKNVLVKLMKKAQEDRFKLNQMNGLTYNIRMEKYKERLEDIDQNLPVIEKRLIIEKEFLKRLFDKFKRE